MVPDHLIFLQCQLTTRRTHHRRKAAAIINDLFFAAMANWLKQGEDFPKIVFYNFIPKLHLNHITIDWFICRRTIPSKFNLRFLHFCSIPNKFRVKFWVFQTTVMIACQINFNQQRGLFAVVSNFHLWCAIVASFRRLCNELSDWCRRRQMALPFLFFLCYSMNERK